MVNYTGNIYKIRSGPIITDPRYFSKVCPKKIGTEKEKLYEENLNLKQLFNYINEENTKLRTKIFQLEKSSEKKENLTSPGLKTHLVDSLKLSIKELKIEMQAKDKEIEDMKRYVRYTKMQELEGELLQYSTECMRLKRIIEDLLKEKNILPSGIDSYEKIKQEKEESQKLLSYYQECDRIKTEQIKELKNKIESDPIHNKKEAPSDEILKELRELVAEQQKEILKKDKIIEDFESKTKKLNSDDFIDKDDKNLNIHTQAFCEKIRKYLSFNNITSANWALSINNRGILSKNELSTALLQDDVSITDEELMNFLQDYGENDEQILTSAFIELFNGSEREDLSIDEIFEIIKAKSTELGVKSITTYIKKKITEENLSEASIKTIFASGILKLEN